MANVIELKVNQMAEKISSYIIKMTTEERFKKMNKHAFYLSGAPGVGKSQGVQEIKRRVMNFELALLMYISAKIRQGEFDPTLIL